MRPHKYETEWEKQDASYIHQRHEHDHLWHSIDTELSIEHNDRQLLARSRQAGTGTENYENRRLRTFNHCATYLLKTTQTRRHDKHAHTRTKPNGRD